MKIARDVKKQKIQPTIKKKKKQTIETILKMTMTVKLAHNNF